MVTKNILLLVEGAKTDVRLMQTVIKTFDLDVEYQIVPYKTNIYRLYDEMFRDNDPEMMDLLQVLKVHDPGNEAVFQKLYSDILLVFDLDPQDGLYEAEKILEMSSYFNESTDNGKLYINYPMVESCFHWNLFPTDENYVACLSEYMKQEVEFDEILSYKEIVRKCPHGGNYKKYISEKTQLQNIIRMNLEKASHIANIAEFTYHPYLQDVLAKQTNKLEKERKLDVLCTCIFFIADFNENLLQ